MINNLINVRRLSDSNISYNKPSFNFEEQQSDKIDLEIENETKFEPLLETPIILNFD